ncbi:MAG: hypothetical protein IT536_11130 [Hyphomicrobiales bacterium]|nr:hypothetical protein [Hyphomicrobiales bacterium]
MTTAQVRHKAHRQVHHNVHHNVHRRRAPQRRQHRRLLAMPLLAAVTAVTAATGFVLHVLWPGWQGPPVGADAPALPVIVAGEPFNLPPAAIRVPMQRQPGAHERVDLAFLWPSLQPPQAGSLPNVPTKGTPKPQAFDRVFVTIANARDSLPPFERVKTIYARYLEAEPAAGDDGLAIAIFRQGTPYQGEDLVFDAQAPERFLARCSRNGAALMPGTCLFVKRIGEADVTVRFLRDWLHDWRSVADTIERLIAGLRTVRSE